MFRRLFISGLLAGLLLLVACSSAEPEREVVEIEAEREATVQPPATAVAQGEPPPTATQPPPTLPPTLTPPQSLAAQLPDLGEAPEIGNELWINSDTPLRLADLRGKVVLIEFWTYG